MKTEANQPIAPTTGNEFINQSDPMTTVGLYGGLTKREHFASLAMQGMLLNGAQTEHGGLSYHPATIAMLAVNQADELIKALNSIDK